MALSKANWDAIWNEGFQTGWNARRGRPRNENVHHAPSPSALHITAAQWNSIYNDGYNAGWEAGAPPPPPPQGQPLQQHPTQPGQDQPAPPPPQKPKPPTAPPGAGGGPAGQPGKGTPPGATIAAVGLDGMDATQIAQAKIVMAVGHSLGAPVRALVAAACIGWGENSWNPDTCNSGGYCGVFQVGRSWQARHDYHDTAYWAAYAYKNGFYGYGGLIHLANTEPTASPGYMANQCQGAYANLQTGADYYNRYVSLANDVVNAFIGVRGLPTFTGAASGGGGGGRKAPNVTIGDVFKSLNWAGDFETMWQHLQGGANESAHMADLYYRKVAATHYVKPS